MPVPERRRILESRSPRIGYPSVRVLRSAPGARARTTTLTSTATVARHYRLERPHTTECAHGGAVVGACAEGARRTFRVSCCMMCVVWSGSVLVRAFQRGVCERGSRLAFCWIRIAGACGWIPNARDTTAPMHSRCFAVIAGRKCGCDPAERALLAGRALPDQLPRWLHVALRLGCRELPRNRRPSAPHTRPLPHYELL